MRTAGAFRFDCVLVVRRDAIRGGGTIWRANAVLVV